MGAIIWVAYLDPTPPGLNWDLRYSKPTFRSRVLCAMPGTWPYSIFQKALLHRKVHLWCHPCTHQHSSAWTERHLKPLAPFVAQKLKFGTKSQRILHILELSCHELRISVAAGSNSHFTLLLPECCLPLNFDWCYSDVFAIDTNLCGLWQGMIDIISGWSNRCCDMLVQTLKVAD